MNNHLTKQIAKHMRDVHFGGNWTDSNLKALVSDLTWEQATQKVESFNTIATLTFHVSYFVEGVIDVMEGKPLTIKDKYSFDHPPINSQKDWNNFLENIWQKAEHFSTLIESRSDEDIFEDFVDPQYGNWFRNIFGIIEHMHYHLGQIALIRKFVLQEDQK